MAVSKTQIDRLGERLKEGRHTESDLRMLDDYRRSFSQAYEAVIHAIRQRGHFPTGRLAKSTLSIVEKLRRESLRLSQMQDIAGCRVVVGRIVEQEQFVSSLLMDFPNASVMDRRNCPSHGYRAIHMIPEILGKPIEIQVRTSLQHLWAEVSEKSADVLDPTIKYGGGPESWRTFLAQVSLSVMRYEEFENEYSIAVAAKEEADQSHEKLKNALTDLEEQHRPDQEVQELRRKVEESENEMRRSEHLDQLMQSELAGLSSVNTELLTAAITWLEERKRQKP